MFSYLRFLLKSTNQHGVHSPFVYNYLTKGIYDCSKKWTEKKRTLRWMLKSLAYFNLEKIGCLDKELSVEIGLMDREITNQISNAEVLVAVYHSEKAQQILATIHQMDTNQLLLLGLYVYPEDFMNRLRNLPEITLVVDFYCGCLISKRTEQQKQNFFLRC